MTGYETDPETLRRASGGIADAISAADGFALEPLARNGEAFGDDAVGKALEEFCSTWELATGLLQQRSASAGEMLLGAADTYAEQEDRTVRSLPRADDGG